MRVCSLGQSLGPEFGSEFGATVWSLGQSLRAEFGARVWCLGSEPESRHPMPNPEVGLGQSLEPRFGFGFGPGFGSEFKQSLGSESGVWVRVWPESGIWSLGQSWGPQSGVRVKSLGQILVPEFAVWVRVWGESLECQSLGQSLGPESRVWSLGLSLGQSLRPEFGVKVWSRVLGVGLDQGLGQSSGHGQSLASESGVWVEIWVSPELGSRSGLEFGCRV